MASIDLDLAIKLIKIDHFTSGNNEKWMAGPKIVDTSISIGKWEGLRACAEPPFDAMTLSGATWINRLRMWNTHNLEEG